MLDKDGTNRFFLASHDAKVFKTVECGVGGAATL